MFLEVRNRLNTPDIILFLMASSRYCLNLILKLPCHQNVTQWSCLHQCLLLEHDTVFVLQQIGWWNRVFHFTWHNTFNRYWVRQEIKFLDWRLVFLHEMVVVVQTADAVQVAHWAQHSFSHYWVLTLQQIIVIWDLQVLCRNMRKPLVFSKWVQVHVGAVVVSTWLQIRWRSFSRGFVHICHVRINAEEAALWVR